MAGIFQLGCWSFGFDSTTQMGQIFSNGPIATVDTASARFAAQSGAVSMGSTWSINHDGQLPLGVQLASMISGIAFKVPTLPGSGVQAIYQYYDSVAGQPQVTIGVNPQGALVALRGSRTGTVLGTSATGLVAAGTYCFLESGVTINNSTGAVRLILNGVPGGGPSALNVTNVNTRNTANSFTDKIFIGSLDGISSNVSYDDWYMLDLTGTAPNNTYLGDKVIVTAMPNADSATPGLNNFSTQPSQSSGNHYLNVRTVPPNDSNYNFSATPGDRESYRHAALSLTNISWVNTRCRFEKDDATARSVAITCRSSGVDSIGTTISSPSSFTTANKIDVADPATGVAWTNSGVDGQEPGLEIIS